MNTKSKLFASTLTLLTLAGCASSYDMVNPEEINRIESVAVVMYSVPKAIQSDGRDATDIDKDLQLKINTSPLALAGQLMGGLTKKAADFIDGESHIQKVTPGQEAADLALPHFIAQLHQLKGWSFKTPQEVSANAEYQQLSKGLLTDKSISLENSSARKGASASGLVDLGLPYNHGANVSFYNNLEFQKWTAKAAKALDVDAVIVMADTGFSTNSQSLFRGAKCFTKSAFHYAMFDKNGQLIAATRAGFEESTIIPQQGCVNGAFHKVDYVNALMQHGKDQAKAITEKLGS